jgi:hypothetical protein
MTWFHSLPIYQVVEAGYKDQISFPEQYNQLIGNNKSQEDTDLAKYL